MKCLNCMFNDICQLKNYNYNEERCHVYYELTTSDKPNYERLKNIVSSEIVHDNIKRFRQTSRQTSIYDRIFVFVITRADLIDFTDIPDDAIITTSEAFLEAQTLTNSMKISEEEKQQEFIKILEEKNYKYGKNRYINLDYRVSFEDIDFKKICLIAKNVIKTENFEDTKDLSFKEHVVLSVALKCFNIPMKLYTEYAKVFEPFYNQLLTAIRLYKEIIEKSISEIIDTLDSDDSNIDGKKQYVVTILGGSRLTFVENYSEEEINTINKFLKDIERHKGVDCDIPTITFETLNNTDNSNK